MGVSLPRDIIVTIIRDHVSGKKEFCTLSLVSRSFCEIAQSVLFSTVTLNHNPNLSEEPELIASNDLHPFRWPKLEFLAQSDKLLRYIQFLMVVLFRKENYPNVYWYEAGGIPILDELDRWLPSSLDRMSSLAILVYTGPGLRGPMHQAILRHKTLRFLKTTVQTRCVVPCKQAMKRAADSASISELELGELAHELKAYGIPAIGPRRCALMSQVMLTHSASLKFLKIPMLLLYDVLNATRIFPDFPRLATLHIEDTTGLSAVDNLRPKMSALAVPFILHVHSTIESLHWGHNMTEDATKQITAGHLPSLRKLSGYRIEHLLRSHSPSTLRIIGLSSSDFDRETDWSLLRETASCLPHLSVLAITTSIRHMETPRDLCFLTSLTEIWYEELPDCVSYSEEVNNEKQYPVDFAAVVLPALPKLKTLCITTKSDLHSTGKYMQNTKDVLSTSSSLRQLTIQFFVESLACFRIDARREGLNGEWDIIQDYDLDKKTLCSISLVCRSFCEAAQRVLFSDVLIHYNRYSTVDDIDEAEEDPSLFEWPKLECLTRSDRVLRHIRGLTIAITYNPRLAINESDKYWQEGEGRSILDILDRFLAPALDHMSSLYSFTYTGPALRTPMHQAILRQKTIRNLTTSAKTHCSVPCKEALQKRTSMEVKSLRILEIGNEVDALGLVGRGLYTAGPRRCQFLSHLILTHSASLNVLKVPISLLYDALCPSPCAYPAFPQLSSLHVEESGCSFAIEALLPVMKALVVSFILHVHETIVTLHLGREVVDAATAQIQASHLPNLTQLSGYRVRDLTRSRQLSTLKIVGLCPNDFDLNLDWSLLKETASNLPLLSTLAVSTVTQNMRIPHDICRFTDIVELWYEETPDCILHGDEDEVKYFTDFLYIVLSALPKLRSLCITLKSVIGNKKTHIDTLLISLVSSRSLRLLTLQLVAPSACFRWDARRSDAEDEWKGTQYLGRQFMRNFQL
ncbi:hypothetical protein FRC17_003590 [Serendipita sp. 399]|nr:hypothetical protein FRC17_003590 [Serendipita sp. 399]